MKKDILAKEAIMGKIYMTACMKGGCAKTVTTYNLAYSLQKLGKKVLAVDFDSQANLSTCFGVEDPAAVPAPARQGGCPCRAGRGGDGGSSSVG